MSLFVYQYIYFLVIGASDNVCDDEYGGPHALSEPEVRALVNFTTNYPKRIDAYITFHVYGQMFMFPYGWSLTQNVENYDQLVYIIHEYIFIF